MKFKAGNVPSDLECAIRRAASTPGPGQYPGVARAFALCSRNSPKFSLSGRTGPPSLPHPYHAAAADRRRSAAGSSESLEDLLGNVGANRSGEEMMTDKVQRSVEAHAARVKAAVARSAAMHKWRAHAGFGKSFFMS